MMIKRCSHWIFILFVVITLAGCINKNTIGADCDLSKGPCIREISGYTYIFSTVPAPPEAMKRTLFTFEIRPSIKADSIMMSLSMPGMYMGENLIKLERSGNGIYRGEGIIVRCPSGATLWQADFIVAHEVKISYRFHVIY